MTFRNLSPTEIDMKEINKKLMAVQQELKAPKSQYNEFNKFNYRNAEDILEAVKPLLASQGLTLVLSDQMEYIGERYYIKATATLSDGEDEITATAYAREDESRSGMSESQVTGCSSSYARKYCLNGLFCIDDGKDSDSFNNKKPTKTPNKPVETPKQDSSIVSKEEALTTFCKGLKGSVDNACLKAFYDYYKEKVETWNGEMDLPSLWKRHLERYRR